MERLAGKEDLTQIPRLVRFLDNGLFNRLLLDHGFVKIVLNDELKKRRQTSKIEYTTSLDELSVALQWRNEHPLNGTINGVNLRLLAINTAFIINFLTSSGYEIRDGAIIKA